MNKFTPGPWEVAPQSDVDYRNLKFTVVGIDGTLFQTVSTRIEKNEANACLVAASVDLLAVLEELQESASYWCEYDVPLGIVDRINAAIAKARGES